jgi:hypothetical protein
MRCDEAKTVIAQFAGEVDKGHLDPDLQAHVNSCPSCADYLIQFRRVWEALESYPSREPAPDFILKTKARLQSDGPAYPVRPPWHLGAGWQWMATAACGLILGAFLFLKPIPAPVSPQGESSQIDAQDDKLLQQIELSLRQPYEDESLADYDSWSGPYFEFSGQELSQPAASTPSQNKRGPL